MPYRDREDALIVFVKFPEPGKVKTRIARELGAERAAEIYSRMAERIVHDVSGPGAYGTIVYFDPPERGDNIKTWLGSDGLSFEPQSGGTIGDRMSDAFHSVFSEGAVRAVLIGTDIPDITADIVRAAFDLLSDADVVLGPAEDGGYYLIGLRTFEPILFRDIDWGADTVYTRTIARIVERNLSHKLLDTLKDVDTAEDIDPVTLTRLRAE